MDMKAGVAMRPEMETHVLCRQSTEGDLDAVYDLICTLEDTRLPFARFVEINRNQLSDPRWHCLVCEEPGGEVIGLLNLRIEEQLHHAGSMAEIVELVVSPTHRSGGIGHRLLEHACDIACAAGCQGIEVACSLTRAGAHRFYEREGMYASHYRFLKMLGE